jgi:hypothetical protein
MGLDLKINTTTSMIEHFKTRGQCSPRVLGVDCYDVHGPTMPMAEIKQLLLLLTICAHSNMERFQMAQYSSCCSQAW